MPRRVVVKTVSGSAGDVRKARNLGTLETLEGKDALIHSIPDVQFSICCAIFAA